MHTAGRIAAFAGFSDLQSEVGTGLSDRMLTPSHFLRDKPAKRRRAPVRFSRLLQQAACARSSPGALLMPVLVLPPTRESQHENKTEGKAASRSAGKPTPCRGWRVLCGPRTRQTAPPLPSFPKLFSTPGTIAVAGAELVPVSFSCQSPLSLVPLPSPQHRMCQPECQTNPVPFLFPLGLSEAPCLAWKLARDAAVRFEAGAVVEPGQVLDASSPCFSYGLHLR
ncbi:UNVERIFIED_CONTAM: hypothetical protein K2H54_014471 [Gekko kuhli]